jgi:HD-like signal output (HDOD) protein
MPNARAVLDLPKLLDGGQLPALPQTAVHLLELSKDPKLGPAEFAVPIETDPGLTSQVLRFVNSSDFGFVREITSVKRAITLVGMRSVKNFALWSAVFSLMPNPKCRAFDLKCLWQDSLRRALFAKAMAKQLGAEEGEEAFVAALLQDMAVPILAKEYPETYAELLSARDHGQRRLSDLERAEFGTTHADVAGCMARHWNLPETTARLIEWHTSLADMNGNASAEGLAVALSALLPACCDDGWPECSLFEENYRKLYQAGRPVAIELLRRVDDEFAHVAPMLKIASPKRSLVECFDEAFCAWA